MSREELKRMSDKERCEHKREVDRLRQQRYREKHKEEVRESTKKQIHKWRAANPERAKELNQKHTQAYKERQEGEKTRCENENALLRAEVERLKTENEKLQKPKLGRKKHASI